MGATVNRNSLRNREQPAIKRFTLTFGGILAMNSRSFTTKRTALVPGSEHLVDGPINVFIYFWPEAITFSESNGRFTVTEKRLCKNE